MSTRYCTFRLADLFLGVEVTRVQEVIRAQETTPVPLVPSVIHGLMNLRGAIVTTVDLRLRLDLPVRENIEDSINVVIRTDDSIVSLLVDEVEDVLEMDDSDMEPLPNTLQGVSRDLIRGVYKLDERLLLVLDTDRILDIPVTV